MQLWHIYLAFIIMVSLTLYHNKDQAFTIWKVANVIMIYLKGIGFLY